MITFANLIESLRKPLGLAAFKKATAHIKNVDNREQEWSNTLLDIMDRYGWKPLGRGKYGVVFAKDNYPYIIKVFMKDTAYLKWLNFCKKNQDNPWLPMIKGKVVKVGTHFMAVRLEKLTPGGNTLDIYRAADNFDNNARTVVKELKSNNNLLDLHDENIMKRKGQTVIIDPYYNFRKESGPGGFTMDAEDVREFTNIL